jgi:hypothetical protein
MTTFIRQGGRRLASWLFGGLLAILAGAVDAGTVDQRHAPQRRTRYFDLPRQVLAEDLPARAERPRSAEERAAEATARATVIDSVAMVDCLAWLDAYFAVQVEYDDQQIAAFQRRLEQMSSDQLQVFLRQFERQRAQLRQAHARTRQLRNTGLALNRETLQRHEDARRVAIAQRAAAGRQYFAGRGRASGRHGDRAERRFRVYDPPLITARTMARIAVYRALLRGWW